MHPDFRLANVVHRVDALANSTMSLIEYVNSQFDRTVSWDDVAWLIQEWNGPFIIKGLLTADDAKRAKEIGLVNAIHPQKELLSKSMDMAKLISRKSPLAIKQTLLSINKGDDMAINDGLNLENSLFAELFDSNDPKEGLSAFMDKTSPEFNDLKKK